MPNCAGEPWPEPGLPADDPSEAPLELPILNKEQKLATLLPGETLSPEQLAGEPQPGEASTA